jgi:hypothetical protein
MQAVLTCDHYPGPSHSAVLLHFVQGVLRNYQFWQQVGRLVCGHVLVIAATSLSAAMYLADQHLHFSSYQGSLLHSTACCFPACTASQEAAPGKPPAVGSHAPSSSGEQGNCYRVYLFGSSECPAWTLVMVTQQRHPMTVTNVILSPSPLTPDPMLGCLSSTH